MTRFAINATLECPSDWTHEKVRQHLRKCLTEKEVTETRIIQLRFTAEECYKNQNEPAH